MNDPLAVTTSNDIERSADHVDGNENGHEKESYSEQRNSKPTRCPSNGSLYWQLQNLTSERPIAPSDVDLHPLMFQRQRHTDAPAIIPDEMGLDAASGQGTASRFRFHPVAEGADPYTVLARICHRLDP